MNFATDKYFYRALRSACKIDEVKFFSANLHTRMKKFDFVDYTCIIQFFLDY